MQNQAGQKLSLRAIEVFVSVVEEGGISAAAKRLGASASAVSLQLSNLEATLGVRLIERSSHRFALSPAGELFHPRALRILDEISAAKAVLSKSNVSPRMMLKLAIVEDFDAAVISPWLSSIRDIYPNLRFHVRSGPSHESHEALANRTADIIVAVEAIDSADWVEEHIILNDPYIVVKSRQAEHANTLDELMRFPFIRYPREQLMGRQIEAHLRRNRAIPPRESEFSSNQMVFAMVAAQGGWTISSIAAFTSVPGIEQQLVAGALPIPDFSRRISLYARRDALGELPGEFASLLRTALAQTFVEPARARLEFLKPIESFRIEGG